MKGNDRETSKHNMNRKSVKNDLVARIPLALQSIFLNGNRGVVVNTPPPGNVAMKKFHRWKWRTDSKSNSSIVTECTVDNDSIICELRDKKTKMKRVRGPSVIRR